MTAPTTDADRRKRLEDAIRAVEPTGNTFMLNNLKAALRELLEASE